MWVGVRCIFPWDSLYSIFGHGGWLEGLRHVLICILRSSSLSGTEKVPWSILPLDGKGSVFTCSTRLLFHKTKRPPTSPAPPRNPNPLCVWPIRFRGSRECFWCVEQLFRFFIWAQELSVAPVKLRSISARLNQVLIWCFAVGFYCVGKEHCSRVPDILWEAGVVMNKFRGLVEFVKGACCIPP